MTFVDRVTQRGTWLFAACFVILPNLPYVLNQLENDESSTVQRGRNLLIVLVEGLGTFSDPRHAELLTGPRSDCTMAAALWPRLCSFRYSPLSREWR